jgi:hypothetical protein
MEEDEKHELTTLQTKGVPKGGKIPRAQDREMTVSNKRNIDLEARCIKYKQC